MPKQACQAVRKDGQPCRAPAQPGVTLCLWHDPDRVEAARAARSQGAVAAGKVRALDGRRRKLETAGSLAKFMGTLIHDVLDGRTAPDTARVVVYAISVQRQIIEAADIEPRLAALERQLADQQLKEGAHRWGA